VTSLLASEIGMPIGFGSGEFRSLGGTGGEADSSSTV
jgi:hypothetical protein